MTMTLPNQLTTLRILLTPVFVWLILSDAPHLRIWGIVVFIVASLTDLYDGYHARKYGQTTRWGAFMDPLADKILITSAFIYFVHLGLLPLWMVIVVALRDVMVTLLRLYAEWKEKPVITSKSAKIKTMLQNVLAYLLLLLSLLRERVLFSDSISMVAERLLFHEWVYWAMLLLTIYTVYTGVGYLVENWQTLRAAYFGTRSTLNAS
ncbi:MAG: CDP-diacylglycerol--glycerol-3-phosphate 3-phosphatidyltransferase [Chloroherpetonaceae bacterium]